MQPGDPCKTGIPGLSVVHIDGGELVRVLLDGANRLVRGEIVCRTGRERVI